MSREVAENKLLLHPYGPASGPVKAMLWELWHLSRWELLFRIFGPAIVWSCVFGLLFPLSNIDDYQVLMFPLFMLTLLTSLISNVWISTLDNTQNGFSFYLGFTRPVTTAKLVCIPMLYLSGTAALCYLLPIGFLRVVFDIPFPLFPVAALIATASVLFIMAVWIPESRSGKAVSFLIMPCVMGALLFFRIKGRVDFSSELFSSKLLVTFSLSILDYLILLGLFVGGIVVTTLVIDRQRHGDRISGVWPSVERTDLSKRMFRWNGPFKTSRQAQYWYELRRSGAPLLLFGLGTTAFVFLGAFALDLPEHKATLIWALTLILSPFVFSLMGAEWLLGLRYRQGIASLSIFDATQAMDNRGLMGIKLIVLFTCVLLNWLFMALAAAMWTLFWGDYHLWIKAVSAIQPFLDKVSLLYWSCIGVVLLMSSLCSVAMIMSGALFVQRYPRITSSALIVSYFYGSLLAVSFKHNWMPKYFWDVNAWLIACAVVVITVLLWRKALCDGFLQQRHFFVSLSLWSAYVGAAIALYLRIIPSDVTVPFSGLILGLSSLLLPLLTIAAIPLSLAIHRTR